MKICGYCNNEYDDKEKKCPVCDSTILKHTKNTTSAKAEYERIEQEIKIRRKKRSMILGIGVGAIAIIVVVIIISIVSFINNPQRAIDKEAKEKYDSAVGYISQEEYDLAIKALDEIDTSWSGYDKVAGMRTEAVKGQLTSKLTQYESTGDYESVISYINENVDDINADAEIKQIYDNSVTQYKSAVLTKADEYVSNGDYSAATSVLTTAIRVISSDSELENKMSEVGKAGILAQVKEYKNNGGYAEAIQYVNDNMDIVGNDSEILIELSSCEEAYRNAVIAEAAEAYQNSGYQAAIATINIGLQILIDDPVLEQNKINYSNCAPVYLTDINPYVGELMYVQQATDNMGNNYSNCYMAYSDEEAATYDLSGKYNTFNATIAVTKAEVNEALFYDNYASIKIIGDNSVLYEAPLLSVTTKPMDISLDVTGVSDLKIVMKGKDTNLNYYNGLYVILSNACLQSSL